MSQPENVHAPIDPDTIYKALRPVPEFDGNPNVLTRFVKFCDQIVIQYMRNIPGSELSNLCLLNGILNKITGPAARTINSNGIPDSWLGIRNALINNFSDQRDETALYNDLSLATQGNSSPQEFYDHCQTLFSTIMTYVSLHENIETTIEAKRDLYKKLTKQAFVRGLKEPLGSRIRCMRPPTIEKALEYVQEELNALYLQQRNDSVPKTHSSKPFSMPPASVVLPKPMHFQPPVPNLPHIPAQRFVPQIPPHLMQRPAPQPFKFNPIPNQSQYHMPTRTQQMFRAPPANYNPRSNVFRLNQNHPQNPQPSAPKPMSGVQHFVPKTLPPTIPGHDWRRYGNPPPSNYFKSREMNVNECFDYDSYYSDSYNYYEPEYYYTEHTDHDIAPVYHDTNYYDSSPYHELTNDEPPCDEPQASTSTESQDFQIARISKKLK